MRHALRSSLLAIAFAALCTLLPAQVASARPDPANFGWRVTHTIPACQDSNNMARQPNRIKYTFAGTGGSIKNAVIVMAPAGTGIAAMSNMVTLTFSPKVPANTVVQFDFTTAFGPVTIASVEYFNDTVVPPALTPLSVSNPSIGGIPTVSEWGLIVIGLSILIVGTIVIRRWQASPATASA